MNDCMLIVTEKARIDLEKNNKYHFKMPLCITKKQAKASICNKYGVKKCVSLNIMRFNSKNMIFRGIKGMKKGYSKVIIKLNKNEKIDIGE